MPHSKSSSDHSIGIFDSGIGGLTVLDALHRKNPDESYIYIGDTARLPYGTKSPETVIKYSLGLARALLDMDVKAIVMACNTASTHAYEEVRKLADHIPVISVIDPTVRAATSATRNGHIAVIATSGTVRSGIYERQLRAANADLEISSQACQILVALAEEGWVDNKIARDALHQYLDPIFNIADAPDTLILGCTHFPVFEKLLREILGDGVRLINSGVEAANALTALDLPPSRARLKFMATDDPLRFAENAGNFFAQKIAPQDVTQIEIKF